MQNNEIDVSDLRRVILSTADQFAHGFDAAKDITVDSDFSQVVVSGMGGSALPSDVMACYYGYLRETDERVKECQVISNRSYLLPGYAYHDTLHLICSHSGNTEETVAVLQEVIVHNLPAVGISSGGVVEDLCVKNGIQHVKLPIPFDHFQPRMATGHFVSVMVQILINAGKIPDITEYILSTVVPQIRVDVAGSEEYGKEIAQSLYGKTPIIYAQDTYRALAMIWKIKINENSKTPAFWNFFPELDHNEFVGFTNPQAQFSVIVLRDHNDHPRNQLRYDITLEELRKKGVDGQIIDMVDGDMLRKIFATIGLGDWVSYYMALAYGQDPTPVDMVEDLKKALQ